MCVVKLFRATIKQKRTFHFIRKWRKKMLNKQIEWTTGIQVENMNKQRK